MWKQIRDADMNTGYEGGWCLKFVQDAFKTDHPDPNATDAWYDNYLGGNHYDLPPVGKTVPVYFSLGNVPEGHVAISLDDGYVASSTQSGYHPKPFFHPNLNDMINTYAKYNGGCTYLGWSEYVGTVHVVEWEEPYVPPVIPPVAIVEPPVIVTEPKPEEPPVVVEEPVVEPDLPVVDKEIRKSWLIVVVDAIVKIIKIILGR